MPQVSRRLVRPEVVKYARELLIESICRCRDLNSASNLINVLLTKTEQVMVAKRVAIALMLAKGVDLYQIEKTLKVTDNTIYSVRNWLLIYGKEFQLLLNELAKENQEKMVEAERLENEAYEHQPRYGTNWKDSRREKFAEARKYRAPPF